MLVMLRLISTHVVVSFSSMPQTERLIKSNSFQGVRRSPTPSPCKDFSAVSETLVESLRFEPKSLTCSIPTAGGISSTVKVAHCQLYIGLMVVLQPDCSSLSMEKWVPKCCSSRDTAMHLHQGIFQSRTTLYEYLGSALKQSGIAA